ncbi:hypothetical protein [Streptomyces sp. NPDC058426]|uniref:hypothetical protein n=1 Tax=Streptomyces sp. NPDC058426 TaxID=3346493 RepID=UPI003650D594
MASRSGWTEGQGRLLLAGLASGVAVTLVWSFVFRESLAASLGRGIWLGLVGYLSAFWQTGALAKKLHTDRGGVIRAQRAFRKREVPADAEERRVLRGLTEYTRARLDNRKALWVPLGILGAVFVVLAVLGLIDHRYGPVLIFVGVYACMALGIWFSRRTQRSRLVAVEQALARSGRADERQAAPARPADPATTGRMPYQR